MPTLSNKRLQAILDRQEPAIRKAFLDAIAVHKAGLNLNAIADALDRGDVAGAVTLAQISPAMLYPLDAAITATFIEGGSMVAQAVPKYAVQFGFDGRATRAERWARENAAGLVRSITGEQVESLQTLVSDRLAAGANSQKLAREVRSVIGLRPDQVRTVNNVRADLEGISPQYFTRKLRDKRFDAMVRKAIASGKPLSATDIDRITQRYAERSLAHRAEVIARTEGINALRAGRDEGVRQAIEQGAMAGARKVWDATGDKRTRPDHRFMDGQERGMDEPFLAPDGSQLMYPGDTSLSASASQTVMCRCTSDYRVDWMRA